MGKTNFDEVQLDNSKLYDSAGNQILAAQQATISAVSAPTAYTPPATGGAVNVTSIAATDLDTASAALKTLRDEVATLTTTVDSVITALKAHGLIA